MSKTSYQIDSVNISPVDTDNKLVTVMPTGAGANALNIYIPYRNEPLIIQNKDLEPTNQEGILKLNNDVVLSNGLRSLIVDYTEIRNIFDGPTISYEYIYNRITFGEPVDEAQALGDAKADETETV